MAVRKTYLEKLKDPRWQKKRLEILNRDKWQCVFCWESNKTLHVHHLIYGENPWDVPNSCLQTLCEDCHHLESTLRNQIQDDFILILKQRKIKSEYLKVIAEAFILSEVDFTDDTVIDLLYEFISKKLKKSVRRYYVNENKRTDEFIAKNRINNE